MVKPDILNVGELTTMGDIQGQWPTLTTKEQG